MTGRNAQPVAALASGLLFGFGLTLSGMTDPARVRAFLDVFEAWNPSLAFVLAGAVVVATLGVAAMRWMSRPLLDADFHMPGATTIDARLLIGSAIFGVGWGIAGLCPGPALAVLTTRFWPVAAFVAAMLAGMAAHDRFVPPLR